MPHLFDHTTAAVSLTYDDGMNEHLDAAMPDLEQHGLRGTFYVPTAGDDRPWTLRRAEWKRAAQRGHEIGNHTHVHPCRHSTFSPDLCDYTHAQIAAEVRESDRQLREQIGDGPRSFAYPCGNTTVGRDDAQVSYVDVVQSLYPAARIGSDTLADPQSVDLYRTPSLVFRENTSLEAVLEFIDDAIARGQWAVLCFHGVGAGHFVVKRDMHGAICREVAQRVREKRVYCGTFVDVAERVAAARG